MAPLLPAAEWFASLPTAYLSAFGLITDPAGAVLMVDPNYREHWTLPGGVVEDGEAPHLGCEREVAEEVGLSLLAGPLLCVHWSAPHGDRPKPFLALVFDCGTVPEDTPVSVQESELDGYTFAPPDQAVGLMHPGLAPRLETALRARAAGRTAYIG
ncbi:NUDIX domain-containing protein [Murinocardiopsis flavida]|uniref:NUDIX domain-containing protein n=1 Tax=Murinocardiopsis flavida TaxID=645275 RepID=A0A2P8DPC3_9ACTN|nr:NUDIX hydrolase [Murinocardiopsis flavida]PSK99059.1 NUDIX domain-containing protein [Murinocardiopsis flavida]